MKLRTSLSIILAVIFFTALVVILLFRGNDTDRDIQKLSSMIRDRKLNIILITVDTLRPDYLGAYGNSIVHTPNIDRLYREGTVFLNAICQSPITLPSHTSILTGLNPTRHGVRDNATYKLDESLLSIAEILREKGYYTSAFISSFILSSRFGTNQGFDYFDEHMKREKMAAYPKLLPPQRRAGDLVDDVIGWLPRKPAGPLFLWIHFFDPHTPYDPPEPYRKRYLNLLEDMEEEPPSPVSFWWGNFNYYEEVRCLYMAEIAYLDEHFGRLIDAFHRGGLLDSSLIIFTSDHGEHLAEHNYFGHVSRLYEPSMKIPLIFRFPRAAYGSRTISGIAESIDIVPTILEFLDIPAPGGQDGTSLKSAIIGEKGPEKPFTYGETLHPDRDGEIRFSIRKGDLKMIASRPGGKEELYHLVNDPDERTDLSELYPDTMKDFRHLLTISEIPPADRLPLLDEDLRENLEALGYLQN